jgi:hypothetical protein
VSNPGHPCGLHGPKVLLSELFGVVSGLRRKTSQTRPNEFNNKQNRTFTLKAERLSLLAKAALPSHRSSGLGGYAKYLSNSAQLAIKATRHTHGSLLILDRVPRAVDASAPILSR